MKNPVSLLRNTAWTSLGTYVEYFLGMVMAVVIARALGPADYGVYAFAIWLSHLTLLLINGGLPTALIRFLAELRGRDGEGVEAALFQRVHRLHRIASGLVIALASGAIVAFGEAILPGGAPPQLLWILLLATVFKAAYMFRQGLAKGREDFRAIALTVLIVAPANTAAVALAAVAGAGVAGFLAVFAGAGLAYLLGLRLLLGPAPTAPADAEDQVAALAPRLRRHILFTTANILLAFLIFKQSEVLFLRLFAEPEDIAFFNIAFTLSTAAAMLVPGVVVAVLLPAMSRAVARDRVAAGRTFLAAARYLWLLGLPVMVAGSFYAANAVGLLYGPAFQAAALPLAILLVASAFHAVAESASSYQISADRQHILLRLNLVLVGVTLGLDWVLIRTWGLGGAVAAFAITTIGAGLFLLWLTQRDLGVRLPLGVALRSLLAALLALALVWPLGWLLPDTPEMLLGGPLFLALYGVASLRLRCWSADDLATGRRLLAHPRARRLVPGGPRFLDRLGARPALLE